MRAASAKAIPLASRRESGTSRRSRTAGSSSDERGAASRATSARKRPAPARTAEPGIVVRLIGGAPVYPVRQTAGAPVPHPTGGLIVTDNHRIKGVLSPVVTPFAADLATDPERFVRQSRWLLSQNVGLAVFGTNSEANSLSVEEKIELLDRLVGAGLDPARMMPGTGCCALPDSVRLTAHAMKVGCGGVLMLPPFYYKGLSDDGLFRSFAEVIERVGESRLRVYLYHIPPVAHVPITLGVVERLLAKYPAQIAGMKDSGGDWSNTKAFIDAFAKSGFDVFAGSETFLLQNMRSGGAGCISATANVNPGPIARLFDTWKDADADAQQGRLDMIRGIFQKFPMIPALKAAIAHHGRDAGWATVRPPLVALTSAQSSALVGELDQRKFTMPGLAAR
ncbi:MAG: dihydrodipicolinate synthase family protein [Candidatus Rokuibacteriota bacterium]|nr:MAG: dihydrodipicolinate synthase family protein [Candidatus Rokubacteria bacterium]